MRNVYFIVEGEENIDYFNALVGRSPRWETCTETDKTVYLTPGLNRTLIGDAIVGNRLDVIEILDKSKIDWNKPCLYLPIIGSLRPLQLSLAIERYEIAQFLIDHGAKIE